MKAKQIITETLSHSIVHHSNESQFNSESIEFNQSEYRLAVNQQSQFNESIDPVEQQYNQAIRYLNGES